MDWSQQNKNLDHIYGFMLGCCNDQKYLNMADWWDKGENNFLRTIFYGFLNFWWTISFQNIFAKLMLSTVFELEIWFFGSSSTNHKLNAGMFVGIGLS